MWYQLKIEHCPGNQVEAFIEELEAFGALSVMLTDKNDDPVLEPDPGTTPLWPEITIQALFSEEESVQVLKQTLQSRYPSFECSVEVLADKAWEKVWMDDFKPLRFGQKLWICPSWSSPPDPKAVNLMLDPGLAFGTGTHPTTALCLTWLEQAELSQKSVIDYGCGSGILSLAASKLGAKTVYAVDIDPQALEATINNARNNHIDEESLKISHPETLHQPVDVLIANILLAPLMVLKERFYQLMHNHSLLVVSGILKEQAPSLIENYAELFDITHQESLEDWSLLVFKRKQ